MRKINSWLQEYWPIIIVFGAVFAILLIDLAPDYTFVNKAVDSIGYAYSAKYLYPSYHTSPPLYLLLGHVFLKIPFATEYWRMALMSVLSTMGTCVFIYLIVKKMLPQSKYLPLLGVLVYGTSALVISQSTVIQTYALVCMCAAGAYYFAINQKWKLMGLMMGIGLAVHILMAFVFIVMFLGYRQYRKNWKALAITMSFGLFYIYIPLTNRPPFMWLPDPDEVNSVLSSIRDTASTISWLIGGLSIWDLPKRIFDTIAIIGVSIAVATIVPIVSCFWKVKLHRNILFWLIVAPLLLFISELDMNTYDYTMLSLPFLAIAICLGTNKLLNQKRVWLYYSYAMVVVVIGFAIFNANYFDIGRTLDKDMSASNLYYKEFAKLPDDAIFIPNYAWEWEAIFKYNMDYDKHIYPICMDMLPMELYRKQLTKDGIKMERGNSDNPTVQSREIGRSIITMNDNVWTTISTKPETFGSQVMQANDIDLIPMPDLDYIEQIETHPQVAWKPYNPYSVITTSITVTQWVYILKSNWNVGLFGVLGCAGYILHWLIFVLPQRRDEVAIE